MPLTERQASKRQLLMGLAAGLGCWAVLATCHATGLFDSFDLRLLDWRFRMRGERLASPEIALVAVDDPTIRSYGNWPLPRDQFALLLQAIEESGARAIGVDLQFPEDAAHDSLQNALLAYVAEQHPNIVHAVSFQSEIPAGASSPRIPATSLAALRRQGVVDTLAAVAGAAGALVPYQALMEAPATLGFITVAVDRDGAIRRQPPLVRYEDHVYASLALRMVGLGHGHPEPPRAIPGPGGIRIGWERGPSWRVALDREGGLGLDFAGDRRAFPQAHSMIQVLREYQEGMGSRLRGRFADRYVLIGLDSRTQVTEDVGTTPFAAATPLVFIHANALDNLLRGRFLTRAPQAPWFAVLAILACVMGWLFSVLPLGVAALTAAAGLVAIAGADFALLALWSVDAPPMAALLLSPAIYGAVASSRYIFLESRTTRRELEIREGRSIEQQFLPEALVGRHLSRYRVEEKLGSGGMGIVYRGRDTRLRREVAIKVLPARALADERTRKRFRREALALSRLNHPHIAAIHDFDSQDGTDFLVLELVSGELLTARLRRGPLPEAEIVRISGQIAEALVEAHAHGVVHRDLKPDNVMITDEGEVKILDFGVASIVQTAAGSMPAATLTEVGHMVGTASYMAPEVLQGGRAEPRSDLYSLGVLIFEMATGRRPFPNDELHELVYTALNLLPPRPRILNGQISEWLEALILKLLAKQPEERYGSAEELLRALQDRAAEPLPREAETRGIAYGGSRSV